jgi:hypothetical protein
MDSRFRGKYKNGTKKTVYDFINFDFSYFILGFYWEGPMQFPWSDLFHPGLVV